jgi:uncharacterized membrane protein YccF (DUF307 family)
VAAFPGIIELKTGPHILVRVVWYMFIGWWLTGIVMVIAWLAAIIVIGLPLTFYLVNRIPTVLTLRPRREQHELVTGSDGVTRYRRISTQQSGLLPRIAYFLLVGWWASALWMIGSYILMITIIGIPLGLMMVNRLPFVFSLHRGYA